jgi:hypothetical protein
MRTSFSKSAGILAGGLVVALTVVTVQRAFATTAVPNASRTALTIAGTATSASFPVPTLNGPVFIMATQLTYGSRSTGTTTLTYANGGANPVLTWAGIDGIQAGGFNGGGDAKLRSGYTTTSANVVILDFGWATSCELVTAVDGGGNTSRMAVRNNSGASMSVVLDMFW